MRVMFSLWRLPDHPKGGHRPPPLHWVETVEEAAAIVGVRAAWLRAALMHSSYIITHGWYIEPNT
jgi:hypothetical protein